MGNIKKIKQLRQSTGAGFKDCSTAIEEAKGDLNKAAEILRVKGISKASKKMPRVANEGVVAVSGDEKKLTLIEVNCETDFVAKNDNFVTFVKELSELNLQSNANIDDLKKAFNKQYPQTKVRVVLGSSGKLTAQIIQNAPYHLFMSANMKYPQALYENALALNKPKVYAKGSLVFISKKPQDFSNIFNIGMFSDIVPAVIFLIFFFWKSLKHILT